MVKFTKSASIALSADRMCILTPAFIKMTKTIHTFLTHFGINFSAGSFICFGLDIVDCCWIMNRHVTKNQKEFCLTFSTTGIGSSENIQCSSKRTDISPRCRCTILKGRTSVSGPDAVFACGPELLEWRRCGCARDRLFLKNKFESTMHLRLLPVYI